MVVGSTDLKCLEQRGSSLELMLAKEMPMIAAGSWQHLGRG